MKTEILPAEAEAEAPLTARSRIAFGNVSLEAEARATNRGILAIGGAISLVLLAVAPIILSVAVVKKAKRALPPKSDA